MINLDLSEQKTEQELLQILLDSKDDISEMDDDVTKIIEDYKNGVEFQAPPTEEEVLKTKKTLASGIGAFFKAKQAAAAVPNFLEMFTANESDVERAQERIKNEVYANEPGQIYEGQDHYRRLLDLDNYNKYQNAGPYANFNNFFTALKTSNQALCRKSLLSILESAGSSLSESSLKLLNQEEMMTKLDDLIHNEHMLRSHQAI